LRVNGLPEFPEPRKKIPPPAWAVLPVNVELRC
jgi:hypothetical protein